jgi:L-cysteine S-thiosulfotransferase
MRQRAPLAATVLAGLLISAPAFESASQNAAADKHSGLDFVSPETRSLQTDDDGNPGMLWVLDGARLWNTPSGSSERSCASCHGVADESMRGVAARYPVFDPQSGGPIDLQTRINQCRTERQGAEALAFESDDLLALSTYVAHQSRGLPIEPTADTRLASAMDRGQALFQRRIGQLDLSCSACHDERWGQRLGGSIIPQAHPTAYPLYRLEWQTVGSLQRRIRGCMTGVRAEPFSYGSAEILAIELYLMQRAAGLPLETPGVRP